MGIADLIPGISGGTVALITGIYEQLISSLASIRFKHIFAIFLFLPASFLPALRMQNRKILKELNWAFLLPLFIGILSAILSMSRLISYLLEYYLFYFYSFFLGIIFYSIKIPWKLSRRSSKDISIAITFAMLVGIITFVLEPISTESTWWSFFLAGSVAICAMILPGISGSYLLILLGKYQLIIEAVKELNFSILTWFALGVLTGALSFVKLLGYLLNRHHSLTMAALTGSMIGSIHELCPFPKSGFEWMILTLFSGLGIIFIHFFEKIYQRKSP